eukprot:scaffold346_cov387-Prasinococcus_capsulatus_cf.AAC.1
MDGCGGWLTTAAWLPGEHQQANPCSRLRSSASPEALRAAQAGTACDARALAGWHAWPGELRRTRARKTAAECVVSAAAAARAPRPPACHARRPPTPTAAATTTTTTATTTRRSSLRLARPARPPLDPPSRRAAPRAGEGRGGEGSLLARRAGRLASRAR